MSDIYSSLRKAAIMARAAYMKSNNPSDPVISHMEDFINARADDNDKNALSNENLVFVDKNRHVYVSISAGCKNASELNMSVADIAKALSSGKTAFEICSIS